MNVSPRLNSPTALWSHWKWYGPVVVSTVDRSNKSASWRRCIEGSSRGHDVACRSDSSGANICGDVNGKEKGVLTKKNGGEMINFITKYLILKRTFCRHIFKTICTFSTTLCWRSGSGHLAILTAVCFVLSVDCYWIWCVPATGRVPICSGWNPSL
jgi:hypothetical protein